MHGKYPTICSEIFNYAGSYDIFRDCGAACKPGFIGDYLERGTLRNDPPFVLIAFSLTGLPFYPMTFISLMFLN